MTIAHELGPSLQEFPTAKKFCSWLGLCPGTRITGGKRISGASKRLPNPVSRALKLAAQGLSRRRMVLRMGSSKAITAVAHKLARIIYAVLTKHTDFVETNLCEYEKRYQERALKNIQRRATQLGFTLVPNTDAVAV